MAEFQLLIYFQKDVLCTSYRQAITTCKNAMQRLQCEGNIFTGVVVQYVCNFPGTKELRLNIIYEE